MTDHPSFKSDKQLCDGDELMKRIVDTLQLMPEENPEKVALIVDAAVQDSGIARVRKLLDAEVQSTNQATDSRTLPHRSWGARKARFVAPAIFLAVLIGVGFLVGTGAYQGNHEEDRELYGDSEYVHSSLYGDAMPVSSSPLDGPTSTPLLIAVVFEFKADSASSVSVVGDFNSWSPEAAPLSRALSRTPGSGLNDDRTEVWTGTLLLPPGRYSYAFVVDGKVVADPVGVNFVDPDYDAVVSTIFVGEAVR